MTINEVESNANSYAIENRERLRFVEDPDNSNAEYQCITVQNLIDYGYLDNKAIKSKVSDTENVNPKNNVYLVLEKNNISPFVKELIKDYKKYIEFITFK